MVTSDHKVESSKVVIIDDDDFFRPHLESVLEDHGFEVVWANSLEHGKTQISLNHDARYAVIDIMMPPGKESRKKAQGGLKSGIVLAGWLKKKHPSIQIIAISTVKSFDAIKWFEQHSIPFLQKGGEFEAKLISLLKEERASEKLDFVEAPGKKEVIKSSSKSDITPGWWSRFARRIHTFTSSAYTNKTWIIASIIFVASFTPFAYLPTHNREVNEYNKIIDENALLLDETKLIKQYQETDVELFKEWNRIYETETKFLIEFLTPVKNSEGRAPSVEPLNQAFASSIALEKRLSSFENELQAVRFYSIYANSYKEEVDKILDGITQMRSLVIYNEKMAKAFNSTDAVEIISFVSSSVTYLSDINRKLETSKTKSENDLRRMQSINREVETRMVDLDNRETLIRLYSWVIVVCSLYILGFFRFFCCCDSWNISYGLI